MGMLMGKALDENMQKQQEFMLASQRMQMERQLQMQNLMRERMMATQVARARDMFQWWAAFYGVASLGMIAGFAKSKNKAAIAPLVPLTFIVAYQYDLAYWTKLERIRDEADRVLEQEGNLLAMPHGLPTIQEIDDRRSKR